MFVPSSYLPLFAVTLCVLHGVVRRLGKVLHVTRTKRLLVKVENMPRLYDEVYDENLKPVGKVYDILGPVSSPYASIEIDNNIPPEKFVGKVLYLMLREKRRGGRRRKK